MLSKGVIKKPKKGWFGDFSPLCYLVLFLAVRAIEVTSLSAPLQLSLPNY
jgi:hypothetical protein